MTNSLTDITQLDIITHVEQNFNRDQATGLNCLIFLSLREQTTVAYQRDECGFDDIPEHIATWCDALGEDDLLQLTTRITSGLLDEIITAALHTKNVISVAEQTTEPQKQPELLSDY